MERVTSTLGWALMSRLGKALVDEPEHCSELKHSSLTYIAVCQEMFIDTFDMVGEETNSPV